MAMTNSRRDSIIDDLLVKFPRGANRKLKKHNYSEDRDYCYESGRHKVSVHTTDSSKHYGYSMLALFDLNLRSPEQIKKYVIERFLQG